MNLINKPGSRIASANLKTMDTKENRNTYLHELGGSNYEIADGQENIKGWTVKDRSGEKLGEVDELIFDERSSKVRYIVLDMDDNELNLDDHRKVLVPIGIAVLDEKEDEVILDNVTTEHLLALPEYDEDGLGPNLEREVSSVFGRGSTGTTESDFYDHAHFNDSILYRSRQQSVRKE